MRLVLIFLYFITSSPLIYYLWHAVSEGLAFFSLDSLASSHDTLACALLSQNTCDVYFFQAKMVVVR